jgi:hypothetical protein
VPNVRFAPERDVPCIVARDEGSYGFELVQKPYPVEALSRVLHRAIAVGLSGFGTVIEGEGSGRSRMLAIR